MKATVLTLFPELVETVIGTSITGRALAEGHFALETVNIRDFAVNSYGKVDDYCFGGGTGMLMMCQPVFDAHARALTGTPVGSRRRTIYLSPKGSVFNQRKAIELAELDHLVLLCGHYEGIDQRVLDEIVDEELSLGDFVLTGGELAACVVIDAVARLIKGVLPNEDAYSNESHMAGTLEYPQYTRPSIWHGKTVPDVLMSGHHAKIIQWQEQASLLETCRKRPDMFDRLTLDASQYEALALVLAASSGSGAAEPGKMDPGPETGSGSEAGSAMGPDPGQGAGPDADRAENGATETGRQQPGEPPAAGNSEF